MSNLESVNWCPETVQVYDQILASLTTSQADDVWNTYSTMGVHKTAIHAIKARLESEIYHLVEQVAPYSVVARILPCFDGKTLYYTTSYLTDGDNPATLN